MGEGAEITFNQITFTYIIDIKFGPVTKLDKRNKTTSKHFNDDDMLENCEVIFIFPIYGHNNSQHILD